VIVGDPTYSEGFLTAFLKGSSAPAPVTESKMSSPRAVPTLEFGLEKKRSLSFGLGPVNNVLRLNSREHMATCTRGIVRFERDQELSRYRYETIASIYSPMHDTVILVTPNPSQFRVFYLSSMRDCVFAGCRLDQLCVVHMFLSRRADVIVTVGLGIKTWRLHCRYAVDRRGLFEEPVTIVPLASFAPDYSASMLSAPVLDSRRDELTIIMPSEVVTYSLDGRVRAVRAVQCCLFSANPFSRRTLTCDDRQGVCYWREPHQLVRRFSFTNYSVFVAHFVSREFVICVDVTLSVHIVDLKLGNAFAIDKLGDRPTRIFYEGRLVLVFGSIVHFFDVTIPWRLWTRVFAFPLEMRRCPMQSRAARIGILFSDGSVQFLSPRDAQTATLCHSRSLSTPTTVLVDRGIPDIFARDHLFVCYDDGDIEVFNCDSNPSVPSSRLKFKATCLAVCLFGEVWVVAVGTRIGDVLLFSYEKLRFVRKLSLMYSRIVTLLVHQETRSLFVVYEKRTIRLSLIDGSVIGEYSFRVEKLIELFGDLLVFGFENGTLVMARVCEMSIEMVQSGNSRQHMGEVTSMAAGSSFFVTTGSDGSVLLWNLNGEIIASIKLPLRILSSCVLNGTRSILIGNETAIMIIDGRKIFGTEVDEEDRVFDNFDRLRDELISYPEVTEQEEVVNEVYYGPPASGSEVELEVVEVSTKKFKMRPNRPKRVDVLPIDEKRDTPSDPKRIISEMQAIGNGEAKPEREQATTVRPGEIVEEVRMRGTRFTRMHMKLSTARRIQEVDYEYEEDGEDEEQEDRVRVESGVNEVSPPGPTQQPVAYRLRQAKAPPAPAAPRTPLAPIPAIIDDTRTATLPQQPKNKGKKKRRKKTPAGQQAKVEEPGAHVDDVAAEKRAPRKRRHCDPGVHPGSSNDTGRSCPTASDQGHPRMTGQNDQIGASPRGPDGKTDPRFLGPDRQIDPRLLAASGEIDSRLLGKIDPRVLGASGQIDPPLLGASGQIDPKLLAASAHINPGLSAGCGQIDPRLLGAAGQIDPRLLAGSGQIDRRLLSGSEQIDLRLLSGSGQPDPRFSSSSGQVDPRLLVGSGQVDPQLLPGSEENDLRLLAGSGQVAPRLLSGSGQPDPIFLSSSGQIDPGLSARSGQINPRLLEASGTIDPRLLAGSGQVDPRLLAAIRQMGPRLLASSGQFNPRLLSGSGQIDPALLDELNLLAASGQIDPRLLGPDGLIDPRFLSLFPSAEALARIRSGSSLGARNFGKNASNSHWFEGLCLDFLGRHKRARSAMGPVLPIIRCSGFHPAPDHSQVRGPGHHFDASFSLPPGIQLEACRIEDGWRPGELLVVRGRPFLFPPAPSSNLPRGPREHETPTALPVGGVFSETPIPSAVVTPRRLLSRACPPGRSYFSRFPNYAGTHCIGDRTYDAEGNLLSDRVGVKSYRVASLDKQCIVLGGFLAERTRRRMIENAPRIVHPLSGRKDDFKTVQSLLSRARQREKKRSDR
jgi:WD40 repeat protein